jgi:hypothetical protein
VSLAADAVARAVTWSAAVFPRPDDGGGEMEPQAGASLSGPGQTPALTGGGEPVAVRMFPGQPAQVREARRWVRAQASGTSIAALDDIGLTTAELFANAEESTPIMPETGTPQQPCCPSCSGAGQVTTVGSG